MADAFLDFKKRIGRCEAGWIVTLLQKDSGSEKSHSELP
jgi:hypothetical protein